MPVTGWFALGDAAGLGLLEVRHQLAGRRVDPEEVVDVLRRRLALGATLRDQRNQHWRNRRYPVLVPTPAPVRLNHASIVNVALRRSEAAPSVAYCVDPLNCSAVFAAGAVTVSDTVTMFESDVPSFAL